ncbi:hypothetical protein CAEBREN_11927 [Caenorhabditis brenneri]|uniref:Uncharacterized protein n=1 Tax=Caenorhabditis brenneri TaxID=135651 RepID=G0MD60_CAEBE|nr:hypothetical protein CAEBREN_11927 [Caenorhabditis brenneri]
MDPLLTAILNLGCQSLYQKLITEYIEAKELERKKYQDTVIKMKFTMNQKVVEIGDKDGVSAFENVVASDECVVETKNGPMLVPNGVMQSELQKFNLNTDLPELANPCPSCKFQGEKLKFLEDSLRNVAEEKSKCQMECQQLHSVTQNRELFWRGQAQNLVEKLEYYKNLCSPVPMGLTEDEPSGSGAQAPTSPPSPDFIYPPMEPRRRSKQDVELPEPLNQCSDEYKILLHQALTNTKTCPIYRDKKIVVRSCLFSALGSSPMPQLVNNPPRAHLLYRKWRENTASWITMSDIIKEWDKMRIAKTREYMDWKGRENALYDEHMDQLKKGYITCYKRKKRVLVQENTVVEKRKSYAREAVTVPIGSNHGVVFVDL